MAHLHGIAHADPLPFATHDAVDLAALLAGHVPAGDGIGDLAVAGEAAERANVLASLNVGDDAVAAAEKARRKGKIADVAAGFFVERRVDDAGGNGAAVAEVEKRRDFLRRPSVVSSKSQLAEQERGCAAMTTAVRRCSPICAAHAS